MGELPLHVHSSAAHNAPPSDLDLLVRGKKAKVALSVIGFTIIEVILCLFSLDRLSKNDGSVLLLEKTADEAQIQEAADNVIDSGVIEVVLFAVPFMLVTNVMVLIAIARDNVWLLLPWMVLHCVVTAFLALGAAILSAHGRYILGTFSLLGAIFFLLCWKGLRQLFMKMVDRQLKEMGRDKDGEAFEEGGNGIEEDEESMDMRHRQEVIFFGSKDRKFNPRESRKATTTTTVNTGFYKYGRGA